MYFCPKCGRRVKGMPMRAGKCQACDVKGWLSGPVIIAFYVVFAVLTALVAHSTHDKIIWLVLLFGLIALFTIVLGILRIGKQAVLCAYRWHGDLKKIKQMTEDDEITTATRITVIIHAVLIILLLIIVLFFVPFFGEMYSSF